MFLTLTMPLSKPGVLLHEILILPTRLFDLFLRVRKWITMLAFRRRNILSDTKSIIYTPKGNLVMGERFRPFFSKRSCKEN